MDVMFGPGKQLATLLLAIHLIVITACGGGGGDGSNTGGGGQDITTTPDTGSNGSGDGTSTGAGDNTGAGGGDSQSGTPAIGNDVLSGQFIDSPVAGLTFSTMSQSGTTDQFGAFQYIADETVTFSLGDIYLGESPAATIITPVSLVPGAVDETHAVVTNIVRFLLSLDTDENFTNGIGIDEAVRLAAVGKSLDFSSVDFETTANALLLELTSGIYVPVRTLVDSDTARQHLHDSLLYYLSGIYEGTLSGDDTGTWRLVLGIDGSVTGTITGALLGRQVVIGTLSSSGVFTGTGPSDTESLDGAATLAGMLTADYMSSTGLSVTLSGERVSLPATTDPIVAPDPGTGTDPGSGSGSTTDPAPGTSPGTSPTPTIPLGQLDIIGDDTKVIGTQFVPDTGYHGVNAIQYKVNGGSTGFTTGLVILNLSAEGDLILATFSWANGNQSVPATVVNTYSMYCVATDTPSDCSTVSVNTTDMTVTFANAIMDKYFADSTAPIILNGTLDYLPLP